MLETRRGLKPGSDQIIRNTSLDPLYQTQRIAPSEYRFDVSEGQYEITLCFARLSGSSQYDAMKNGNAKKSEYSEKPGKFNVYINDQLVLKDYDPGETDINFAINKTFRIKTRESIVIRFEEVSGEPIVNGIVIRKI